MDKSSQLGDRLEAIRTIDRTIEQLPMLSDYSLSVVRKVVKLPSTSKIYQIRQKLDRLSVRVNHRLLEPDEVEVLMNQLRMILE